MIQWLLTSQCLPPHRVTHPTLFRELAKSFMVQGQWGRGEEALVGYTIIDGVDAGKVQLLSGSHRWAAADFAKIMVPVVVLADETVEKAWGDLEMWSTLMGMGRSYARRYIERRV